MNYRRQPTRNDFTRALNAFLAKQPDNAHRVTVELELDTAKPGWVQPQEGEPINAPLYRIWLDERRKALARFVKNRPVVEVKGLFEKKT